MAKTTNNYPVKRAVRGTAKKHKTSSNPGIGRLAVAEMRRLFVAEYLANGFNGTAAAVAAGYSPKTAHAQAHYLLKNPEIIAAIKTAQDKRVARLEATADNVLEMLWQMATADMSEAFNPDGTLKSIHDMPRAIRNRLAGFEVSTVPVAVKDAKGNVKKDKDGNTMLETRGLLTKVRFTPPDKLLELSGKHVNVQAFKEQVKNEHSGGVIVEMVNFNETTGE